MNASTGPKADLNKSYCNHSLCLYISVPCPSMQHPVGLSDFLPQLYFKKEKHHIYPRNITAT